MAASGPIYVTLRPIPIRIVVKEIYGGGSWIQALYCICRQNLFVFFSLYLLRTNPRIGIIGTLVVRSTAKSAPPVAIFAGSVEGAVSAPMATATHVDDASTHANAIVSSRPPRKPPLLRIIASSQCLVVRQPNSPSGTKPHTHFGPGAPSTVVRWYPHTHIYNRRILIETLEEIIRFCPFLVVNQNDYYVCRAVFLLTVVNMLS